jgi:CRISPR/Cas system CMR-associated protein Cmr1 (group 7 of RAMP superfamily)
MNIEPSLQSFMETNIQIAQTTFSEEADDAVLREFVLFTFAQMRLAEKQGRGDKTVWVKTDLLKDLESQAGATEENEELAEFTRMILTDIIETTFEQLLRLREEGSSADLLNVDAKDSKRPSLTAIPGGKES